MSSQDDEPEFRALAFVLMAAVTLAVGLAVGIGIQKSRGTGSVVTTAPAAPAAAAAAPVGDDASVVVENGVVRFYFASGKSDLASGALAALADAIQAAQAGRRLVISGYHDATGDPAFNAELARQRAFVVRDALAGAGVAGAAMELRKPEQTTGSGNHAEARRVEVVIAP